MDTVNVDATHLPKVCTKGCCSKANEVYSKMRITVDIVQSAADRSNLCKRASVSEWEEPCTIIMARFKCAGYCTSLQMHGTALARKQ